MKVPPRGDYRRGTCLMHGWMYGPCCPLWVVVKTKPFLLPALKKAKKQ